MISGASDKELIIANARADVITKLNNTSAYESWLVIDTYIEQLENTLNKIREEFLKYDWKTANQTQIYNQLRSLYESIFYKALGDQL